MIRVSVTDRIQFCGRTVVGFEALPALGGRTIIGFGAPPALGIEDSGKLVSLTVGDTIFVKLPGKEISGSGWVLTPGDPRVIDVASTSPDGGTTFVAKGAGSTHVEFAYRHPHERQAPIQTAVFDFTITDSWLNWKVGVGVLVAAAVAAGVAHVATRKKKP